MSSDARISTAFPSHPKTKKLARRLGSAGPLGCIYLFLWAAANRSDGALSGMTGEDIELAVDWAGDDGAFVAAMVAVGFLDGEEGAYRIHDWADHNPWAQGAAMRSAKARWNAVKRHHGEAEADRQVPEYAVVRLAASSKSDASSMENDAGSNAPSTDAALPSSERSNAPSPSPSPSPEEHKSSLRSDSSSAAPDDASGGGASQRESLRLAAVTDEAIAAWNASALVKANGGLLAAVNPEVGRDKRRQQVKRCVSIARDICRGQGHSRIPAEFWAEYFAAAARDDFHSGRLGGGRGHENWIPDFDHMTQSKTMLRLFEREEAV